MISLAIMIADRRGSFNGAAIIRLIIVNISLSGSRKMIVVYENYFLMLSAGIAMIQYPNDASPPERKLESPVLIYGKQLVRVNSIEHSISRLIRSAVQSCERPHQHLNRAMQILRA